LYSKWVPNINNYFNGDATHPKALINEEITSFKQQLLDEFLLQIEIPKHLISSK
jgi:hypothetical protein